METIVLHTIAGNNLLIYPIRQGGALFDRVVIKILSRGSEVFKKEVLLVPGFLGLTFVRFSRVQISTSVFKGESVDLSILVLKKGKVLLHPVPFVVPPLP